MPLLTTTKSTSGGTGQSTQADASAPAATASAGSTVPFQRASILHRENTNYDQTLNLGAAGLTAPIIYIPAYGFLRSVLLRIDVASVGGAPALQPDGLYSAVAGLTLQEPNGQPIFQVQGGHNLYLISKYGGYRGFNEPKAWQGYSSAAAGGSFWIRVPLELNVRDAIGALANQNSGAQYQVRLDLANLAAIWSSAPTTATVRIRAYAEEWDQPAPDTLGQANELVPPANNTTQYWSRQDYQVPAGQFTMTLRRTGNWIRNLIFVCRDATGARTETLLPVTTTFALDSQTFDIVDNGVWRQQISERAGYFGTLDTANAQDTGVYLYDFSSDWSGRLGFETRSQWLWTLPTTRFDLSGVFQAAGTVTVLTNDIVIPGSVF